MEREERSRIRGVQMDNIRGLLGIRANIIHLNTHINIKNIQTFLF